MTEEAKTGQALQIQFAIDTLNQALEDDPIALTALLHCEVQCNKTLADHPTIQVGAYERGTNKPMPDGPYWLRPLGLINGLFGADTDTWGFIAMDVDKENGHIIQFIHTPPRKAVENVEEVL